jgi:hypothetical protein
VDKRAKPGEAGYAPPEVIAALSQMDDPHQFPELLRVGRSLAQLYRPVLSNFVKDYLVDAGYKPPPVKPATSAPTVDNASGVKHQQSFP